MTNENIQVTVENFNLTAATEGAAGSITGNVKLELGGVTKNNLSKELIHMRLYAK